MLTNVIHQCERAGCDEKKLIPQSDGTYLCSYHNAELIERKKSKKKNPSPSDYVIDESELRALRMDNIIQMKAYIYFAFHLDYQKEIQATVDITKFCQRWGITKSQFLSNSSLLSEAGMIEITTNDLLVKVFNRGDKAKNG